MPVARAMRAAAANQIMMLAVNPLSSVCTNVHRDQYCTTRIEFLVILSFTHFYGRAAAELSFSDLVLRTFTGLMKTVISYNSLNLYLYYPPQGAKKGRASRTGARRVNIWNMEALSARPHPHPPLPSRRGRSNLNPHAIHLNQQWSSPMPMRFAPASE